MRRTITYMALALTLVYTSVCMASQERDETTAGTRTTPVAEQVTPGETAFTTLVHLGTDASLAGTLAIIDAFKADQLKAVIPAIQVGRAISLVYADHIALKAARQNPTRANIAFAAILLFHTLGDAAQATPQALLSTLEAIVKSFPVLPAILAGYESFIPSSAIMAAITALTMVYIFIREGSVMDRRKTVAFKGSKPQAKRTSPKTDIRGNRVDE